jgi:hypothetical protein
MMCLYVLTRRWWSDCSNGASVPASKHFIWNYRNCHPRLKFQRVLNTTHRDVCIYTVSLLFLNQVREHLLSQTLACRSLCAISSFTVLHIYLWMTWFFLIKCWCAVEK